MITAFDDYPVHQTPEPVARPATTDRNFYDRYWFNGFDRDGEVYFGVAFGLYPNRSVMDGAFSVVVNGEQHSFHASRRAPTERRDLTIGPLSIEFVEPMRLIRVRLGANDTGIECDLTFRARTAPFEEPRSALEAEGRVILDTCRFVQLGTWSGEVTAGGTTIDVEDRRFLGVRDRSWGIRPVGERELGAPPTTEPGIYWLWSVNHFDDHCTFYETFEGHHGEVLLAHAAIIPAYSSLDAIPAGADPGVVHVADASVEVEWASGTRWARHATFTLSPEGEAPIVQELQPCLRFHFKGLGYQHPEWGHGVWKGEEAFAGERWRVDELDPLAFPNFHVQQVCQVTAGDRRGHGVLEQLVIGSHTPSGIAGFSGGAP